MVYYEVTMKVLGQANLFLLITSLTLATADQGDGWPTVSRLSALSQSQSQHNHFQCHGWGMLRLKVITQCHVHKCMTDHDMLDAHRIVHGVNNLGIEDT